MKKVHFCKFNYDKNHNKYIQKKLKQNYIKVRSDSLVKIFIKSYWVNLISNINLIEEIHEEVKGGEM